MIFLIGYVVENQPPKEGQSNFENIYYKVAALLRQMEKNIKK